MSEQQNKDLHVGFDWLSQLPQQEWDTAFVDTSFYLSTHQNIGKLLQIQMQIIQQKKRISKEQQSNKECPLSLSLGVEKTGSPLQAALTTGSNCQSDIGESSPNFQQEQAQPKQQPESAQEESLLAKAATQQHLGLKKDLPTLRYNESQSPIRKSNKMEKITLQPLSTCLGEDPLQVQSREFDGSTSTQTQIKWNHSSLGNSQVIDKRERKRSNFRSRQRLSESKVHNRQLLQLKMLNFKIKQIQSNLQTIDTKQKEYEKSLFSNSTSLLMNKEGHGHQSTEFSTKNSLEMFRASTKDQFLQIQDMLIGDNPSQKLKKEKCLPKINMYDNEKDEKQFQQPKAQTRKTHCAGTKQTELEKQLSSNRNQSAPIKMKLNNDKMFGKVQNRQLKCLSMKNFSVQSKIKEIPKFSEKDNVDNQKDIKDTICRIKRIPTRNKSVKQEKNSMNQSEGNDVKWNSQAQKKHKQFESFSLSRKGLIAREVTFNENETQDEKSTEAPPFVFDYLPDTEEPSCIQSGRKVFELEFVKKTAQPSWIENEDNQATQCPEIKIRSFKIPILPQPPGNSDSQTDINVKVRNICDIFSIPVKSLQQVSIKKYRNCLMITVRGCPRTIVWHQSGKIYAGGWDNTNSEGNKEGQGFELLPNVYAFRGQFMEGKRNGSGIMLFANGDVYDGQWLKGYRNGLGSFYEKATSTFYQGEWKQDRKWGKGVLKINDNHFYDGTFQDSLKHGYGRQVFENGDIYRGEYKFGKFHGRGIYFWKNGSTYEGSFKDGKREGLGIWRSGKQAPDIFIGQYKADKKQGKGQYTWQNGTIYNGYFLNDLKHGEGRIDYSDGKQIKGFWENGNLIKIQKTISKQQNHSFNIEQSGIKQIDYKLPK